MKSLLIVFCFANFVHADFRYGNERLLTLINYPKPAPVQTGKTIRVAIIDSGLSAMASSHKNTIAWKNFIEPEKYFIDYDAYEGHGTAVTDIIWQFAPNVEFIALAVSNHDGAAKTEVLVDALEYAYSFNPDIINISLSISSSLLETAIRKIGTERFYRTLIITSAGNDHQPHQPHNFSNLIKVGALTLSAPIKLCAYSDYGRGVDIAVPTGSADDGIATIDRYDQPRLFNGTSAATAVVTGVAALIAEKHRHLRGNALRKLVFEQTICEPLVAISEGRVLRFKGWN